MISRVMAVESYEGLSPSLPKVSRKACITGSL